LSSRDNVIGTATRLYAGRSGVRFLAMEESFLFSSTSFLDRPLSCSMDTVGKMVQPKFTANLHLLRRLRMSKATHMSTPTICLHRVFRNKFTMYKVYFLSRIVICATDLKRHVSSSAVVLALFGVVSQISILVEERVPALGSKIHSE